MVLSSQLPLRPVAVAVTLLSSTACRGAEDERVEFFAPADRLLAEVVDSPVSRVVRTTTGTVRRNEFAPAVPALLKLLLEGDASSRSRASQALFIGARSLTDEAIDPLLRALEDSTVSVRHNAAYILPAVAGDHPRTLDALGRLILTDERLDVRYAALHALSESGDPRSVPYLMGAITDAITTLPAEGEAGDRFRKDAMGRLASLGPTAAPALRMLLEHPTRPIRKRAELLLRAMPVLERRQPIIDVHRHAAGIQDLRTVRRAMENANVVLSHLSLWGDSAAYREWYEAAAGSFLLGPMFPCTDGYLKQLPCFPETNGWPDAAWLRREFLAGRLHAMGELTYVYYGIPPTDSRLAPYFALAEELDIPVGVHLRYGERGDRQWCCPDNNGDYSDPALLGPILARHPGLSLYLMHAGQPAILKDVVEFARDRPNVYVDMIGVMGDLENTTPYEAALRAFGEAGMLDRIMLGSDGRQVVEMIAVTESMDFLSEEEKRGIYYDNAARFFKVAAAETPQAQ